MGASLDIKLFSASCLGLLSLPARLVNGRLGRLWAFAQLKARVPSLDTSVVILGTPELHGTCRIRLGRHLYLYRALYLETQGDGRIDIDDGVVLSRGVHIVAHHRVSIGRGTMVGEYTSIRDANHVFDGTNSLRESGHKAAPIHIGCNVWIGRGASILAGVMIGDGAVVGANAVVTRDVAPGAVVVGAPAKALRSGHTPEARP